MPAILDEAFNSPFSRFKGLNPHGQIQEQESSDTVSIRAPQQLNGYGHRAGDFNFNYGLQGSGSSSSSSSSSNSQAHSYAPVPMSQMAYPYGEYAIRQRHIQPSTNMDHACDQLIARIMSCPHCRAKIRMQYGAAPEDIADFIGMGENLLEEVTNKTAAITSAANTASAVSSSLPDADTIRRGAALLKYGEQGLKLGEEGLKIGAEGLQKATDSWNSVSKVIPWDYLNQTLVGNFIFGVVIIYVINMLVKLKA